MRRHDVTNKKTMTKTKTMIKSNTFREHLQRAIIETCDLWDIWSEWLGHMNKFGLSAPQSGALRISAYRDFQSNPYPTTYSFWAFKPFYGDLKQPKRTKADQCRPRQTKAGIKFAKFSKKIQIFQNFQNFQFVSKISKIFQKKSNFPKFSKFSKFSKNFQIFQKF